MSVVAKTIAVTGVSSGIGRAIVDEALARGHRVAGCARRRDRLDELAREHVAARDRLHLDVADVAVDADRGAFVDAVLERFGGVDVLIHNAGFGLNGPVDRLTVDDYREQMETNFFAVVDLTRRALPHLEAGGGGDLVMISSVLGHMGLPGRSPYCASKWALEGYAHSIRPELRRRGVRVSIVNPGFTATEFGEATVVRGVPAPAARQRAMSAEEVARIALDCIGRQRRNVRLTGLGKLGVFLHRRFPWLIDRIAERQFVAALDAERGR